MLACCNSLVLVFGGDCNLFNINLIKIALDCATLMFGVTVMWWYQFLFTLGRSAKFLYSNYCQQQFLSCAIVMQFST